MDLLEAKFLQTKKAISSIKTLLDKTESLEKLDSILELALQEALIKQFEYSIDTFWEYLKTYLQQKHGIEQKSPKSVFKECFRIGLITKEETTQFLDMVEVRNQTSYTYSEEIAEKISNSIPEYYKLMQKILYQTTL